MYLAWFMRYSLPTVLFIDCFISSPSCCRLFSRKPSIDTRDCLRGECLGDFSDRRCQELFSRSRGLNSPLALSDIMRCSLAYSLLFSSRETCPRWWLFLTQDSLNFQFHRRITAFAYLNSLSYFSRFLSTTHSQRASPPSALLLLSKREQLLLALALFCFNCKKSFALAAASFCLCIASWWARAKRSSLSWWCWSILRWCDNLCLNSSLSCPRQRRSAILTLLIKSLRYDWALLGYSAFMRLFLFIGREEQPTAVNKMEKFDFYTVSYIQLQPLQPPLHCYVLNQQE